MLLQRNIVKKYLSLLSEEQMAKSWAQYQDYFLNADIQANIQKIKEEQFQEGFFFLKELKKQKIQLSLKEQDNWEGYFNDCQTECQELTAQIVATDREIDNRVFDLYGLTEDERKTVLNV